MGSKKRIFTWFNSIMFEFDKLIAGRVALRIGRIFKFFYIKFYRPWTCLSSMFIFICADNIYVKSIILSAVHNVPAMSYFFCECMFLSWKKGKIFSIFTYFFAVTNTWWLTRMHNTRETWRNPCRKKKNWCISCIPSMNTLLFYGRFKI